MSERARIASLCLAVSLLTGCAASEASQAELDEWIAGASALAGATATASQLANARSGAAAQPPLALRQQNGTLPKPEGYSQRGAFEACAQAYTAAGRPDLAAKCQERATNMNSLPTR